LTTSYEVPICSIDCLFNINTTCGLATSPFAALIPCLDCSAQISSLASFATDPAPWFHWEASSDQMQPIYLGKTPLELAFEGVPSSPSTTVRLPETLKDYAFDQLNDIVEKVRRNTLALDSADFTFCPVRRASPGFQGSHLYRRMASV